MRIRTTAGPRRLGTTVVAFGLAGALVACGGDDGAGPIVTQPSLTATPQAPSDPPSALPSDTPEPLPPTQPPSTAPPVDTPTQPPVDTPDPQTPTPQPPPASEPSGDFPHVPPFYVSTDGDDITLSSFEGGEAITLVDGHDGIERESMYVAVAVRPGSTPENLTVVALSTGEGMYWLEYVVIRDHSQPVHDYLPEQYQVSTHHMMDSGTIPYPVFSPDGKHLAWAEQPGDGAVTLRTLGWTDSGPGTGNPADDNASFELSRAFGVRLHDWVWTEGMGTETAGALYASTADLDLVTYAIERQGDGALAVQGDAQNVDDSEQPELDRADSHSNDGTASGPEYELRIASSGQESFDLVLRWSADGDQGGELEVPASLEQGADPSVHWITARHDGVLIGNGGGGQAWLSTRGGGLRALGGVVNHAAIVD